MTIVKKILTLWDAIIFSLFVKPGSGECIEVRILEAFGRRPGVWDGYAKGTVVGYFDDHKKFCECVQAANKNKDLKLYMTLQVIDRSLIGRACNRLKASAKAVGDADVEKYRWIMVDLDPIRASGISSSDEELERAMELRETISEYITSDLGMPAPIKAMSGNGAHLLIPFLEDLPAKDPKTAQDIKKFLEHLAAKFDNEFVSVDRSVYNPSRLCKIYGTTARKGDHVPHKPGRPGRLHRKTYIDDLGIFAP